MNKKEGTGVNADYLWWWILAQPILWAALAFLCGFTGSLDGPTDTWLVSIVVFLLMVPTVIALAIYHGGFNLAFRVGCRIRRRCGWGV